MNPCSTAYLGRYYPDLISGLFWLEPVRMRDSLDAGSDLWMCRVWSIPADAIGHPTLCGAMFDVR